jgi:hypothetical protein
LSSQNTVDLWSILTIFASTSIELTLKRFYDTHGKYIQM